jgi:isopentenyldiphosphate isomerase
LKYLTRKEAYVLEEMLYHVNENDEVLGKISRDEAHSKILLHRTGMVFLINKSGKVLINRRSPIKKIFPSCYDSSVSFHVTYGESYKIAAKRETEEEIKIIAPLKYIGKFIHKNLPEYQIVSVFICLTDESPIIDLEEFSCQKFCSRIEAENIIKKYKITPWLRDGWQVLIKYDIGLPKSDRFLS